VNGDIGFIRKIVREDDETFLHIQFDDRYVEMKRAEANDLTLAYAMSIHKSQGGQFSKVIMPMHMSQYAMLQRNLLYTGITRAKEEVDIFGEERALKRAVKTEKNSTRQTGLKQALLHLAGLADAHTGDAQ
jgi:exodeoxyribonuclease V alpha subunit